MNLETLARITGDVAEPTPDLLLAGRRRLDDAIKAADAVDAVDAADGRVSALSRRRRRLRWGVSALAGAAVTAAALIALPLLTTAPASAEAVLLAAADAAALQADEGAGAQYWHVVDEVDDHPGTDIKPFRREVWMGRSRDSVMRSNDERTAGPVPTRGGDGPALFFIGTEQLTWGELVALPTEATQLGALLRAKVQGQPPVEDYSDDDRLWETVTQLLRDSPASPALRRALWQVAASIPDVELLGPMNDSVGRPGVAVERNELGRGWNRTVYILDPADGTLLEYRSFDAGGALVYRLTQLEQGPRETAPVAQPPVCGPDSESKLPC